MPGSPGLAGDPDLAYLSIADERERERAEREYLQQDSEHMAALEEAYARLREQNAAMEQQLKVCVREVGGGAGRGGGLQAAGLRGQGMQAGRWTCCPGRERLIRQYMCPCWSSR